MSKDAYAPPKLGHPTRLHLEAVRRRRYGPKAVLRIALDMAIMVVAAVVFIAIVYVAGH